jgi:hypothetical protein
VKKFTLFLSIASFSCLLQAADEVDYNRDVRPILAEKCYPCHGPDKKARKAKLRLDDLTAAVKSGAITPGKPADSELVERVFSDDPDERMPPKKSKTTLNAREKELLRKWVAAGARTSRHWAFVPPQQAPPPATRNASWPRNPIDHFILARLEKEKLKPAEEADRYTLVRRLYLDLVGLPPTPEEADAFVNDKSPKAYESLVNRLLEAPGYGERWARDWLDLARYADSNGYEKDRGRTIWPWRDWVIRALNEDMPYDQFTIEQLAGDMLPNPTPSQVVATGFHRNTMLNEEGGIDPLEYRFYSMVDRVATTGTVWMGLTTGCAQCHSHKYDPISHTDYYQLMALLDNADEPDYLIPEPTLLEKRAELEKKIEEQEAALIKKLPDFEKKFATWSGRQAAVNWQVLRPSSMKTNLPRLEILEDGSIFSTGDITKLDTFTLRFKTKTALEALRLEVLPDDRLPAGGPGRSYYEGRKGDFFLSEITAIAGGEPLKFTNASRDYGKITTGSGKAAAAETYDGNTTTGWATSGREGKASQLVLPLEKPVAAGSELELALYFERHYAASLGRFRLWGAAKGKEAKAKDLPTAIEEILAVERKLWTPAQADRVKRYFLRKDGAFAGARKPIDALRKQVPQLNRTMVLRERPADNPRPTYRYHRGEYLSPKEQVQPAVLKIFPPLPDGQPANRLTFARWLASERNPLLGRVTVNRAWRAFFGAGLLRTSGDFGTQSEPPDHPELLDWMAVEFRKQGLSMKKLHKLIVSSAVYRQASNVSQDLLERDPANRLLARGPRHRLSAEAIRDLMLKGSGRLSPKMFGPSVYPPQPGWVTKLAYGSPGWNVSKGENRYRRSLYTFTKRTAPFASFTTFDAPSGEGCIARRDRSNTPLQALVLLNDDMYVELARYVAREAEKQAAEKRADFLFRRFLTRPPEADEKKLMDKFLETQIERLKGGKLDAAKLTGDKKASGGQAALFLLARSIMNLDEVITRQ